MNWSAARLLKVNNQRGEPTGGTDRVDIGAAGLGSHLAAGGGRRPCHGRANHRRGASQRPLAEVSVYSSSMDKVIVNDVFRAPRNAAAPTLYLLNGIMGD